MSSWGRNDQAVTANSTTTRQTSNGAPTGTYVAVKAGGGANAHFGNTSTGSRAATDVAMFNNATPGAFISGVAVGVFGVSATEQSNNKTNAAEHGAHAGWNLRRAGTGPIISISANATLTGYNNVNVINVRSPATGGVNATISYVTNASGGSLVFTVTNPGSGFNLVTIPTSNISFTNATGGTPAAGNTTTTNLVITAGGRAGRIHHETLIAMGSLGAQTAAYGTPATANDASTDNTYFPGT